MQIAKYTIASRELLRQATQELALGDTRQASERGWGAAVQMVKALAEHRGWDHHSHEMLFQAVDQLARETTDSDLVVLFQAASGLHTNFYEDWYPSSSVAADLRAMERFLDKVEPLL